MRHFRRVHEGLDVGPILAELDAAPELWSKYRERKDAEGTPHAEMDDLWVRYRPREELTGPAAFQGPHVPAFYPAWSALPSLQPVVWSLMAIFRAVQLGGILLTRIPPGGRILPHDDRGSWHAEQFNTKVYVTLRSNARCVNVCMDEEVNMRAGEIWTFNNLIEHSVENNGATDRITAIVCMRTEA